MTGFHELGSSGAEARAQGAYLGALGGRVHRAMNAQEEAAGWIQGGQAGQNISFDGGSMNVVNATGSTSPSYTLVTNSAPAVSYTASSLRG